MTGTLGVIGCGKMAYALLKGITRDEKQKPDMVYICDPDPNRLNLFAGEFKAVAVTADELVKKSEVIIIAVKPHQVQKVLNTTSASWTDRKILLSVAAGIKTTDLEKALPDQQVRVVRVMPNTPCLVGEGMAAFCAGSHAAEADLKLVQALLSSSGKAILIQEQLMDAVTAISGSGPAYVFLLVEAMQEAAVNIGLSSNTARELILQTIKGSISMLEAGGEHPAVLKEQVCSPGGSTIVAVRQLEEGGIRSSFFNAIEAAYKKNAALGDIKN